MRIALHITGHGYGHASRALTVMAAIRQRAPETEFFLRTAAPREFVAAAFPAPFHLESVQLDTGAIEHGGLSTDVGKTIAVANEFYARAEDIIAREAALLRDARIDILVFDVPPLSAEIASRAGVPSIAIANFTWDRIYRDYPDAEALVEKFARWYGRTTLALEVPLGHEVSVFPTRRRIPIIARKSTANANTVREELGLGPHTAAVLVALRDEMLPGGELPGDDPRVEFLTFGNARGPRVRRLPEEWQRRFPDVLAACDAVLSKPGYGIVAECIANRTPLLHLPRHGFAETPYLLSEMEALMGHRAITMEELSGGGIIAALVEMLGQSIPWPTVRTDGADVAAEAILSAV